jgi:hypothetical protein
MQTNGVPEDLLSFPEVIKTKQNDMRAEARKDGLGAAQKIQRGKWGPTLVEKRPSRFQKDGRTILEKAQERKMINNLKVNKGKTKPCNKFSVLCSEIYQVAEVLGVKLVDNP